MKHSENEENNTLLQMKISFILTSNHMDMYRGALA